MKRPSCPKHPTLDYDETYDAYFCPLCDEWLEPECSCPPEKCPFPKPRPARPSMVEDRR